MRILIYWKEQMREREFKNLIKLSVRRQHGVYIPLAAPMTSGLPDAYINMPSYIPILMECKWLGEIKREKFSRTPQFSPMQINFLQTCHDISPYSAMGGLGFIYEDKIHCALVAYGTPLFYNFNSDFKTQTAWVTRSAETKVLDIVELFGKVPIPRIRELTIKGLEDIKYEQPTKLNLAV